MAGGKRGRRPKEPKKSQENPPKLPSSQLYSFKYHALLRRCNQYEEYNAKLRRRLKQVGKLTRRLQLHRSFLRQRLAQHGEQWQPPYETTATQMTHKNSIASTHRLVASNNKIEASERHSHKKQSPAASDKGKKRPATTELRKPVKPFLLYYTQHRPEVAEAYKNRQQRLKHQELSRVLADGWRNMSASQRKHYYDLYEADKIRYKRQLEEVQRQRDAAISELR